MLIVESQSLDVYRNLAIEEYLMEQVVARGPILFLWRSDRAVVMGKNQNPWRECRLDRMADDQVPLARRISGGGAVYHDEGDLNYCVIVDRTAYQQEQAYDLVRQALETFDIRAEKTGKSNLSVDGRKFSGNAFCFRKGRALHHGTLLLNTDLDHLGRYLGSTIDGIETRAIASEPAHVMNLGLGVTEVSQALASRFSVLYEDGQLIRWTEAELPEAELRPLMDRHVSPGWKFCATPRFAVELGGSRLEVEHGLVTAVAGPNCGWLGRPFAEVAHSLA